MGNSIKIHVRFKCHHIGIGKAETNKKNTKLKRTALSMWNEQRRERARVDKRYIEWKANYGIDVE